MFVFSIQRLISFFVRPGGGASHFSIAIASTAAVNTLVVMFGG